MILIVERRFLAFLGALTPDSVDRTLIWERQNLLRTLVLDTGLLEVPRTLGNAFPDKT